MDGIILFGGLKLKLIMSGEAARICEISQRTLVRHVEQGELKPVDTVEGRMLFNREDVEKFAKKYKSEKKKKAA